MAAGIGNHVWSVAPGLLLASALRSSTWFFAALIADVVLLGLVAAFGQIVRETQLAVYGLLLARQIG